MGHVCPTCRIDDCNVPVCSDDDNHLPCPHSQLVCPEHCLTEHEGEAA